LKWCNNRCFNEPRQIIPGCCLVGWVRSDGAKRIWARAGEGLSSAAQYRRQIGAFRSVARQQSAGGDIGSAVHNDGSHGRLQTARGSGADGRALSAQVAVSEKSLREDSRTVSRFVAALAEGMQFNRNKSKILAKYSRMLLEKNRAMIEEGYETYRELMLKKPYADPSAMKILTAMIAEANPKARNIDPASLSIRLSSNT
jgi:hypothetical protein